MGIPTTSAPASCWRSRPSSLPGGYALRNLEAGWRKCRGSRSGSTRKAESMQYLRTPLTVPRYVLTVKYALFVVLGFAVGTASAPSSFQEITPDWYTPIWGSCCPCPRCSRPPGESKRTPGVLGTVVSECGVVPADRLCVRPDCVGSRGRHRLSGLLRSGAHCRNGSHRPGNPTPQANGYQEEWLNGVCG